MRQALLSLFVCSTFALLFALNGREKNDLTPSPTTSFSESNYCGTNLAWQDLLNLRPDLLQDQERLEEAYYQDQRSSALLKTGGPPYTIPVVFHIIHEGGTEQISDADVQVSLDFLNQSFANTGPYDPSTGVATDIEFCLAQRTPEGTLSTGVERVNHPLTNLNMSEDLDMKNLSRYDPTQYLNIWVVREICSNTGCGVAGYAYFPSAHGGGVDGIVVEARWLGNTPGGSSVLTHEVGHYLGLYHTFEGGCTNDDCLADGDRVCDTPPDQSTVAVPCNASPNSCMTDTNSGFAADQPDMFKNYMDYGDWDCYSIFTEGQRERMHFFLDGIRASLLSSQGCLSPCTIPVTVSITTDFSDFVAQGENVELSATGSNADTFTWYVDGVEIGTGNPLSYTFPDAGSYQLSVAAGNSDPNCLATDNATVSVRCPVQASFTASSTNIGAGSVVYFTNESANGSSFEWQVDGNPAGNDMGFFYQFDNVGTYVVSLIAGNGNCTDDFSIVITVGLTGNAQTGLPIWPMQAGSNGGFHTLDWRPNPPFSSTVASISEATGGATGAAFNSCGEVVFYIAHTAVANTTNQLFAFAPDGTALLNNSTANAPGLNAVRGSEIQVIPVPNNANEWYILYRNFASDAGAPLNNAAYRPLEISMSHLRLESDGTLSVIIRDQLLTAGGTAYLYSDGLAVSRTVNGDASRHYLYATRRNLSQNSLSLDRWIIDENGINWESNTGTVAAQYWELTHAGSPVELSPTEDRVVTGSRNQWSNYVDYVIFSTDDFSNSSAVSITTDNLIVVADGQPGDDSSILPVNQSISQLANSSAYPLRFLRNFPHKISRMEFSPNGRFLYLVGGGFQSGSSQLTTTSYLAQIDLETSPLQVRLQAEAPPAGFNSTSGLGCSISQCGDDWNALTDIESSFDGNLYFVKRNVDALFVIPNPNSFLPQRLEPGVVDLATAEEPNISLPGRPGVLPDQIDGFNYLSAQSQSVELNVFGFDCAGECRSTFEVEIISSDNSYRETFTIGGCPTVLNICADTSLSYRMVDLELGIEYVNAIVNGEVNAPAGGNRFEFSEPQGCPEDCDEPYVFYYGEGENYGGQTLLSHDGFLFVGGNRGNAAMLTKMTPAGQVVWTQIMQPIANLPNTIVDLKVDSEGALIGAGNGRSGSNIESFAFKLDPDNGSFAWTEVYQVPGSNYFLASDIFQPTAGGDYVLLGSTQRTSATGCDATFYEINRNSGAVIGDGMHYHLGSCEDFFSAIVRNGNFFMTGRFNFANGGFDRMRPAILSTTGEGVPLWSRLYLVGVNQNARLYSTDIIQDGPNNLLVLAQGDDNGTLAQNNDLWIFRTNLAGGAQWALKYTFAEAVQGVEVLGLDNGYLILARADNSDTLYVLRVNGAGTVVWAKQLSDLTLGSRGDEMIIEGNYIYLTAVHTGGANEQLALLRMELETGALPTACIPDVDATVSSQFITSPYDGFNSISPYDATVNELGDFQVSPDDLTPLAISCSPACGPEDCDNGIDDDGDGFADCEDTDCDCEDECEDASFVKIFGNPQTDEAGYSLVHLPNGNILLGAGSSNYFQLLELTTEGAVVHDQKFSTPDIGIITDLLVDSDGLVVGSGRIGNTATTVRGFAFRYDYVSHSLLWMQQSALTRNSYSIFETSPGGDFIISAAQLNASSPGSGDDISWIALDRNTGAPNFAVSANESQSGPDGYFQSIVHNGKVFHAGRIATSSNPNRFYSSVARYTLNGTAEWIRILHRPDGSNARLYAYDIDEYDDELYILSSGDDNGSSSTNSTVFIYKMSTDGQLLWTREYDIPGMTNDWGHEMTIVADGILVYGDELGGDSDLFLFKVNFNGDVMWAKRYLAPASEGVDRNATQQMITIGNSIFLTGITESFGGDNSQDIILMRTTPNGTIAGDCLPYEELDLVAETVADATANPITLNRYGNTMFFGPENPSGLMLETPVIEECLTLCEEICDNGEDDDGDGLVDCDDPDLADDCCCYEPPVLELGEDIVVCENGVVVLDAGPGFESYQWSDLTTEQTLTTTFPGLYSVTVTDRCGNTQMDSLEIRVDPASEIDLGPDVELCPGETLTLTLDGFATYEWFPSDGFDCNNCPTVTYTASETDTIIVVATSDIGCISTDTLIVNIGGEQSGMFTATDLCAGDTLTFGGVSITEAGLYFDTTGVGNCLAIDSLEVTLLPTFDTSEEASICAGESLTIFGSEVVTEAGTYTMDFSASNGCDSTHTVILSVRDTFSTSETVEICSGSTTDVFGNQVGEAGDYEMTFSAENGCDSTHTITVVVLDEINTEEEIDICAGETADIFGTSTDVAGEYSMTFLAENGCDSTHTITLSVLDTFATSEQLSICAGETIEIFGNQESSAGDYSMTFAASNGCDSTHTISLTVLDTFMTSETIGICPGDSAMVFGESVDEAGEYTMTFPAENGCDSTHIIIVEQLEAFTTSETLPDQCAGDSVEIFGDTVSETGIYSQTFTASNGCDSTHTVTVTFLPLNETSEEIYLCEGESVEVFGEMEDQPGVYMETYTAANGCDSTHTITLIAEEFTGSANIFPPCPGDPDSWIVYIRTVGNGGPYTVSWNGNVVVNNTINGVPVGDHVAVVTSANGCIYTVEFTVRPYNQPWWGLVSGPSCDDPQSGSIEVQTEPTDEQLSFSLDGVNFDPSTSFDGLVEGTYVLYVKYGDRCVVTDTLAVPGPEEFSLVLPDDQVIDWGASLPIDPITDVTPGASYKWYPSETLDCNDCEKVIASPTETTRYFLQITDENGCTETDDILVKVDRRVPYYVPNVFSPNGDGQNDYFTVYGDDRIEEVERLIIFDRWGGQVFTRNKFAPNREQLGWNGQNRKQQVNPGVYVYYLELRMATGEVVSVKGDVVVLK